MMKTAESIPPRRVPENNPDEKINKKSKRSFAERAITIGRERTTGEGEFREHTTGEAPEKDTQLYMAS
jgi:hypothetical protein